MFDFSTYLDTVRIKKTAVPPKPRKPSGPRIPKDPDAAKKYIISKVIAYIADKYKKKDKPQSSYISIPVYYIYNTNLFRELNGEKYFADSWGDCSAMKEYIYYHKSDFRDLVKGYKAKFNEPYYRLVESIDYYAPACKEFASLNNYITNTLKCRLLLFDDVYAEYVEGKRSTIFMRTGKALLAHNANKCKQIKKDLQKLRKSTWKASIDLIPYTYYGDRFNSYGEDMESEWSGYELGYARVKFITPSGKIAATYDIFANHLVDED